MILIYRQSLENPFQTVWLSHFLSWTSPEQQFKKTKNLGGSPFDFTLTLLDNIWPVKNLSATMMSLYTTLGSKSTVLASEYSYGGITCQFTILEGLFWILLQFPFFSKRCTLIWTSLGAFPFFMLASTVHLSRQRLSRICLIPKSAKASDIYCMYVLKCGFAVVHPL